MKYHMQAKSPVNPTEDLDKVIKAITNTLDYDEIEINDNYVIVTGGGDSLNRLKESLKKRRIRNTARQILINGVYNNFIEFKLSKQAAYNGIVNIIQDELSPLGEITVKIETDNVDAFINWLAPKID